MESGTSIPVTGAAMTLYEAGTGYASGATSLGTATSDGSGDFTISYTPPSPAGELYVVALGGNAGSDNNSAIGLMGIAGLSSALPGSVTINEFTTVAGAWALAQFTDSTGQTIGAPSTNAPTLQDVSTMEKMGPGGQRDPDSSPFALALLIGRRISWSSSLVHEDKAATIC